MAEEIFTASTENLRDLKKQRKRICALVNRAIREKQDPDLISLTKMYALLYSAYVETSFLKLIHTPKAFTDSEIIQIMAERNLEQKWLKCVDLAFNKLNTTNLGEVANKKQTLHRLLQEYIIDPSQIRNKVAHGQWVYCLNNECTKVNHDTTALMANLDFVKIEKYFCIYDKFHQCILDLLISHRTHYRDYYQIITELQDYIDSTKSWSLETKKHQILSSSKYQNYKEKNYGNGAH